MRPPRLLILFFGTIILVAGSVIVFYSDISGKKQITESAPASQTEIFAPYPAQAAAAVAAAATAPQIPAGYLEYRNHEYHFSLFYPKNLKVNLFDEGGGAGTVTFQDVATAQGFEIFISPYKGDTVNDARFKEDERSGVRDDVTDISIDGAVGAAFYSEDASLGPTRELWFIHGGYLYEVTTLKSLDTWLNQIMQTWKFM